MNNAVKLVVKKFVVKKIEKLFQIIETLQNEDVSIIEKGFLLFENLIEFSIKAHIRAAIIYLFWPILWGLIPEEWRLFVLALVKPFLLWLYKWVVIARGINLEYGLLVDCFLLLLLEKRKKDNEEV